VKPPVQLPVSMKNQEFNSLPGGASYVDASVGGGIKNSFDVKLDLSHLLEDIHDVRGRIDETFYKNLFMMLAMDQRSNITAREVAERHEEKLLMLGPVVERFGNEVLDPLVEMTFSRMLEAGIIPTPPEEMQGMELNVEYVSMLAQAQRAVATNSIDRFVMNLGGIAAVKPGILDKFDEDRWADSYADMLGVDPQLIVPSDKVALIRKARAQEQQKIQQAALMEQGANTAAKLSQADTSGQNALTDVTAAFSGYT